MLHPEYTARPSAEKILKYSTVKAIEKKDKKKSRVNYFVSFLNRTFYINFNKLIHFSGSYQRFS